MQDWMRHRCRIPGCERRLDFLSLIPVGWQYEFAPEHPLPKGVLLPGDPDMDFKTSDWNRAFLNWQHEAVLSIPRGTNGYLCYCFEGGSWRIRVRGLYMQEEFPSTFRVRLSRQATRLAFVNERGDEVPIEIANERIVVGDDRYAKYELF